MSERTPEYQSQTKTYLKHIGYDPQLVDKLSFQSDQAAFEYAQRAHAQVAQPSMKEQQNQPDSGNLQFWGGAVVDSRTGEILNVMDNGNTLVGSGRILDRINSMKRMTEDTQEFLERRGVIKKRN